MSVLIEALECPVADCSQWELYDVTHWLTEDVQGDSATVIYRCASGHHFKVKLDNHKGLVSLSCEVVA